MPKSKSKFEHETKEMPKIRIDKTVAERPARLEEPVAPGQEANKPKKRPRNKLSENKQLTELEEIGIPKINKCRSLGRLRGLLGGFLICVFNLHSLPGEPSKRIGASSRRRCVRSAINISDVGTMLKINSAHERRLLEL